MQIMDDTDKRVNADPHFVQQVLNLGHVRSHGQLARVTSATRTRTGGPHLRCAIGPPTGKPPIALATPPPG